MFCNVVLEASGNYDKPLEMSLTIYKKVSELLMDMQTV